MPDAVTRNVRAFRVLVRNALFRRVELAALRRWDLLGELDGEAGWDADALARGAGALLRRVRRRLHGDRHRPRARGPQLVTITEEPERWLVRQVFDDPAGDRDWAITAEVDLAASDEEGVAVVWVTDVAPDLLRGESPFSQRRNRQLGVPKVATRRPENGDSPGLGGVSVVACRRRDDRVNDSLTP